MPVNDVETSGCRPRSIINVHRDTQAAPKDTSWVHPAEVMSQEKAAYFAFSVAGQKPRPHVPLTTAVPTAVRLLALAALMATPATAGVEPMVPNPCRCLLFLHTVYRGRTLRLVIDTGASVNLISAAVLDRAHTRHEVPAFDITGVNGQVQTLGEQVELAMDLSGYPYAFTLYVAIDLPICAILGLDAIIEAGWLVDAINRRLLHVHHALPPLQIGTMRAHCSLGKNNRRSDGPSKDVAAHRGLATISASGCTSVRVYVPHVHLSRQPSRSTASQFSSHGATVWSPFPSATPAIKMSLFLLALPSRM